MTSQDDPDGCPEREQLRLCVRQGLIRSLLDAAVDAEVLDDVAGLVVDAVVEHSWFVHNGKVWSIESIFGPEGEDGALDCWDVYTRPQEDYHDQS